MTAHKEELERVLEATVIAVGAGAVESAGGKVKRPGVFVEIFRGRRGFLEVDQSSVDKVDKIECIYVIAPRRGGRRCGRKKGSITRFTLLRSTGKKGRGRMDTYLETSSTTVSWN